MSVEPRQPKPATSHTDSLLKEGSTAEMTQQANATLADSLLFPCPDNGCTKSYMTYGRLEQHLMHGKHQFRQAESVSLIDRAKVNYAERLEAEGSHPEVTIPDTEIHSGSPRLPEGWACRESAMPRHRLNSKQRRFLEETFTHGGTTGIKANPDDVSKEMRCLRDKSGKRIFTVKEFLRPQQITSFFSRMACKRRDATDSDDEAKEFARQHAAVHSDMIEVLRQEITHPLLFSGKNLCFMTESEIESLKITQMSSIVTFTLKLKLERRMSILLLLLNF